MIEEWCDSTNVFQHNGKAELSDLEKRWKPELVYANKENQKQ